MSIPGAASPLFLGAAAAEEAGYQIDRSLRFNSADSAILSRTPSSAGNRKTWTWSGWVKRHKLGVNHIVFGSNSIWFNIFFGASDDLYLYWESSGTGSNYLYANGKYRDPSAWYHIVLAVDTTQSTASDRIKIYVNGSFVDWASASYPSQNYDTGVNSTNAHDIGGRSSENNGYIDASVAEVHLIDGQALDPTDFGEYDDNNNWNPKDASGLTFGTNGFHLDFADYSDLGDDNSGNGNDWTPNNLVGLDVRTETTSAFSATGTTHGSISNLLNNDTTNGYGVQNGTLTYTPASAITVSSQIVFHYSTDQSNTRFRVNSGSYITLPDPSGVGTYTHSFSGSLTTIEWNAPSSGELVSVHQIQIDNQILVNGSIAAGNDSLIDTPTNYEASSGNNGGNYCTGNPLNQSDSDILKDGNLHWDVDNTRVVTGTHAMSTDKWYWEATVDGIVSFLEIGIVGSEVSFANQNNTAPGTYSSGFAYRSNATKINNNSASSYGASFVAGDVIGVAFDAGAGTLTFYKNGSTQGTAFTGITSAFYVPCAFGGSGAGNTGAFFNFGQRPFAYTPPTGHKSLCTTNLPDPTIADGSTAFEAKTYSGTGSSNSITGLNFSPDFVWIKRRDTTSDHNLQDIIRGTTSPLYSNLTNAEGNFSQGLTAFNSDGFTVGTGGDVNNSSGTYVAWAWDGGSTTATNTDGSVTSNVRANASAGFSIVTYTGTGSGTVTVGHGLNDKPELIVVKDRDATDNWWVQHGSQGHTKIGFLNLANAFGSTSFWGAAPTSSVFSIGSSGNNANDFVAYCFAPVAGYSAFGKYTGNGSTDGPFVYTGFRPRFLLWKPVTGSTDWVLVDSARNTYNVLNKYLLPDTNGAEGTLTLLDFCSNGFKLRTSTTGNNTSGTDVVWAAFAEHPFKTARAR